MSRCTATITIATPRIGPKNHSSSVCSAPWWCSVWCAHFSSSTRPFPQANHTSLIVLLPVNVRHSELHGPQSSRVGVVWWLFICLHLRSSHSFIHACQCQSVFFSFFSVCRGAASSPAPLPQTLPAAHQTLPSHRRTPYPTRYSPPADTPSPTRRHSFSHRHCLPSDHNVRSAFVTIASEHPRCLPRYARDLEYDTVCAIFVLHNYLWTLLEHRNNERSKKEKMEKYQNST